MFDVSPWNELLQNYVDDQGRVNYKSWLAIAPRSALVNWLHGLAGAVEQGLTQSANDQLAVDARLALWLNLYNALVIEQILQQFQSGRKINSIQPKILGVPNWVAFLQFFTRPVYRVNDTQKLSLNQIEHGILRPQFHEPRIHFALVCGAIGCPLLRNEAYTPERVQSQLEEDAIQFINNPNKVRYDEQANVLYCSKILKWYGKDFLHVASSIPAYIRQYLHTSSNLSDATTIRYLPYDWHLNQRTSL
jgi:hypothetical protein